MIIRLYPLFARKIWGGNKLKEIYGDHLGESIGECWGLSAHKSQSNLISGGPYQGMTFRELYLNNRELFGNYPAAEFPLLMKLIDAAKDLSIQVHPDEHYAAKKENQHGKDECWYIIDAAPDARIIIGHNAKSSLEFKEYVGRNDYSGLLKVYPIKKGDYFYIPAGTIHAICENTLLFEVSQSSDVTYRVYDYDRLENGRPREMHLDKALEVIDYENKELIRKHQDLFFKYRIKSIERFKNVQADRYGDYIHILSGHGEINGETLKTGDFLMVSSSSDYRLEGEFTYAVCNLL
ncbi:MAG: type I phosphomannose isomerase catalytic subunit [Candidatus Izemoplasmatales bacterium]